MIVSYLKYIAILIILVFIQKTFIWLLSVSEYNISPDIVIIFIIYVGLKNGQIEGALYGFFGGLLIDILSGSFLGLSTLCYTIAGFTAGYFFRPDDEKFLYKFNFLYVVFPCTLLSNFIYYLIYLQGLQLGFFDMMFKFILTSTVYTTIISLIFIIIPKRTGKEKLA
ncbi:MAG TPA: rod shape-determining protein MreD [Ignavibacteria bacterium]|nr:rod shape-determining protein MreD [Ignavibacteria bacterium]